MKKCRYARQDSESISLKCISGAGWVWQGVTRDSRTMSKIWVRIIGSQDNRIITPLMMHGISLYRGMDYEET